VLDRPRRLRIIVVDDEKDVVSFVRLCLEEEGFEVASFTDPILALNFFRKNYSLYQIFISDIRMPGMKGLTFARTVKSINNEVKVILMTAFEMLPQEFEQLMPSIKIDGFIKKPFSRQQILEKVSLLNLHV